MANNQTDTRSATDYYLRAQLSVPLLRLINETLDRYYREATTVTTVSLGSAQITEGGTIG